MDILDVVFFLLDMFAFLIDPVVVIITASLLAIVVFEGLVVLLKKVRLESYTIYNLGVIFIFVWSVILGTIYFKAANHLNYLYNKPLAPHMELVLPEELKQ